MAEYFLGGTRGVCEMRAQLALYRQSPEQFVHSAHPNVSFVTLEQLVQGEGARMSLDLPLLRQALAVLPMHLPGCEPFDPARVWIGVAAPTECGWFGGFYHPNQGYRYLQQIALTSVSGAFCLTPRDPPLRTLELLRAYVHDTIHAATYRLFCPLPVEGEGELRLYRLQYGINFRRWHGQSYSARDSVRSKTTHNLGNIMEGATDRFAQEFVREYASRCGYQPPSASTLDDLLYRDCTGQLDFQDVKQFHAIECGQVEYHFQEQFKAYLKLMRLFTQYVTLRYQTFLTEWGGMSADTLHHLILPAMISGKLCALQQFLNHASGETRSFVSLFKTSAY